MENINQQLEDIVKLRKFCEKRGYERMMAEGCEKVMYKQSYVFDFHNNIVTMEFREATSYDYPHCEYVTLTAKQIAYTEEEWNSFITSIKNRTDKRVQKEKQIEADFDLQAKRNTLERLKKELGE